MLIVDSRVDSDSELWISVYSSNSGWVIEFESRFECLSEKKQSLTFIMKFEFKCIA